MKSVYRNYDKSSSSLPTGVGTYSGAVVSFAASELMPIATGSAAAVGLSDTGQWYRCTADITAPLSHVHVVLQEDGGQWVVGRILEGAALEDKTVYHQMYQEMIQYNGK